MRDINNKGGNITNESQREHSQSEWEGKDSMNIKQAPKRLTALILTLIMALSMITLDFFNGDVIAAQIEVELLKNKEEIAAYSDGVYKSQYREQVADEVKWVLYDLP